MGKIFREDWDILVFGIILTVVFWGLVFAGHWIIAVVGVFLLGALLPSPTA